MLHNVDFHPLQTRFARSIFSYSTREQGESWFSIVSEIRWVSCNFKEIIQLCEPDYVEPGVLNVPITHLLTIVTRTANNADKYYAIPEAHYCSESLFLTIGSRFLTAQSWTRVMQRDVRWD